MLHRPAHTMKTSQKCNASTCIEAVHHQEVLLGLPSLSLTSKGSWLHLMGMMAKPLASPLMPVSPVKMIVSHSLDLDQGLKFHRHPLDQNAHMHQKCSTFPLISAKSQWRYSIKLHDTALDALSKRYQISIKLWRAKKVVNARCEDTLTVWLSVHEEMMKTPPLTTSLTMWPNWSFKIQFHIGLPLPGGPIL